jgi:hypothetical protein
VYDGTDGKSGGLIGRDEADEYQRVWGWGILVQQALGGYKLDGQP